MTRYPLAPSLTHHSREYAFTLARGVCFSGVLLIYQSAVKANVYAVEEVGYDDEDFYGLIPLPPAPRWFALRRCGGSDDEGLYLVRVGQGAGIHDACECFGFNRWQGCKHIDALRSLVTRRVL